jgi:hypothetical protein
MGDTQSSARVDAAHIVEDKREPLPRQIYLALRLKELSSDLQSLVTERQGLNAALKDRDAGSSTDIRKMRERRGYLAIRINVLRAEQQGLVNEKDALPPMPLSLGGGPNKKGKAAADARPATAHHRGPSN